MSVEVIVIDDKAFDVLSSDPNTLHCCFLKYIEDMIGHITWKTTGKHLDPIFAYNNAVVSLYSLDIGEAILLLFPMFDDNIKTLYETLQVQLTNSSNLKIFVTRLADVTFGSRPHNLLFFLTIITRIFTLIDSPCYTNQYFVGTVAGVLEENKVRIMEMGGFSTMDKLVADILENPETMDEFNEFICGKSSDYL